MKVRKHFRNCLIYIIISIAIMGIIFYFSSENSQLSNNSSGSFKEFLFRIISPILPERLVNFIMEYIRKIAHFTLYFCLGISTSMTAREFCLFRQPDLKIPLRAYACAFAFCTFYAVSDEFHQHFVPGRSGKPADVLLDSCGFAVSILIIWLINTIIYHRHQKSAT